MSPVFAHGQLRLYLLVLLAERPMHGYELIQALGTRFGGVYVPSAGTVYPRLGKLQEDGLVTSEADGRKTVYAITEAGRDELAARQDEVADLESGVTDSVRSLADGVRASVGEAMRSLRADLAASARPAGPHRSGPHPAGAPTSTPNEGARSLREVELLLATFRQEVRAEARRRSTRGTLTPEVVAALRRGLDGIRSTLRD
ncbi:PadR family transcriptional regulator [Curtobacterium sp. MCBD17_034]|uniref:PadR family transcriptional regulator n=1 Tax=unclassified Curtobacterium TaxID=257496 RepID=UPI000DAABB65|nr:MULTISPECIES: PadR family transcriptional regulator [unclassified Curtobacterium]PZF62682.1 PadR family transcriptional regulator [Curtobacterium sp. MCBD17_034]PZM40078.1 PadR family transcriptional regulator [Curtobacterium sp. MCBD17_031]WIB68028.1 PadR family transcriptional regulator [Curtobacterium sp. MCBD17_035]